MTEAKQTWAAILHDLGINKGDAVYLAIDMGHVPLPSISAPLSKAALRDREKRWCEFILDVLLEAVGSEGTILAPTFSYDYARNGAPYYHETSASEIGPFTEYFRQLDESIRSFHPLYSVSGIGPRAAGILEDIGRSAFGIRSPFAKFPGQGVKFLFLGTPLGDCLTYAHHVEQLYGVNHMFNRAYNTPVFKGGVQHQGPWMAAVRYLGVGITAAVGNLELALIKDGSLRICANFPSPMQCAHVSDVDRVLSNLLDHDPCALLEEPVEVHIQSPGSAEQPLVRKSIFFDLRAAE